MAGDFIIINKYLVRDLMKLGIWNIDMKNTIISHNGSIQNIDIIPQNIKDLYKTVWEIKQKVIIDQAVDRGPFICQTQSMNLFFEEPTPNTLTSALFHGWKKGLKTGCYYIRNKPKAQAQQFTIDPSNKKTEEYEACEMCSA
jgi:ribonucleoside-diphosphate reductase alpha chain